jgi:hypothetical protein
MYSFGLYEDDYWFISHNFTKPVSRLPQLFLEYFRGWPQGRPLNHFLPVAFSALGYKLGGLAALYALAAIWLTLNSWLVYAIVRRLLSGPSALIAATVYVLFPADTTKVLLTHASIVQASMTFLLLGLLFWLKGGRWRWASYPVAGLSLLTYETAFLPFLAAPLFWIGNRTASRIWLLHLTLCGVMVAGVAYARLHTGDARAVGAISDLSQTARMLVTSLYLGPITSLKMMGKGAWIGIREISTAGVASLIVLLACFSFAFRTPSDSPAQTRQLTPRIQPGWSDLDRSTEAGELPWWWVLISALVMWSGSYALTLINYPPTQEFGRLTSTHVAAGWGLALATAALFDGVRYHLPRLLGWFRAAVIVWTGALLLYQDFIQREYVRAWHIQQDFWSQIHILAPEAAPGWTIIVTGDTATQSPIIYSNSWADFYVANQLFDPDPETDTLAFAHLGMARKAVEFRRNGAGWQWKPQFWGGSFELIDARHLILFNSDFGRLRRVQSIETPVGILETSALDCVHCEAMLTTPLSRLMFRKPPGYTNGHDD